MSSWVDDQNVGLYTDFYELTMAQAYLTAGTTGPASFELFVRSLPDTRRFLVAAGLADALAGLMAFSFPAPSIDYLRTLDQFDDQFLEWLADMRFDGTVHAIPEGEVVYPNEPLLRVSASLPIAQLVETYLLSVIGHQTMIASKAVRIGLACGNGRFVDFAARRAHATDAGLRGARAAYIGGAAATSLTLAGHIYGIPVSGTMAHSFVMSFDSEADAFRAFARRFPNDALLLIDTYDTVEGARIAAEVATELAPEGVAVQGVRLDSGDLTRLSKSVRAILDEAGHPEIRIFASGDLDEYRIGELVGSGAPIDGFGVGTKLGTSLDSPALEIVYKLVADEGAPVMKLSSGKATLPGKKQVWRNPDHDVLGTADEEQPGRPLLEPVMEHGRLVREPPTLDEVRERRRQAVEDLPSRLRSLTGREEPWLVRVSPALQRLADLRREDVTGRPG